MQAHGLIKEPAKRLGNEAAMKKHRKQREGRATGWVLLLAGAGVILWLIRVLKSSNNEVNAALFDYGDQPGNDASAPESK